MKQYEMAQLAQELSLGDGLFILRSNGLKAYPILEHKLTSVDEKQPLILVFPPEHFVDSSFADEAILALGGKLVAGEFGERGLLLQGLSDESIKSIEKGIRYYELKLPLLAVTAKGDWRVIGHLEPNLREALAIVHRNDATRAVDLAEELNLSVNAASNRLKRLFEKRLVWRQYTISEKGLEYIYYFWQWTSEDSPHDQAAQRSA